MSDLKRTEPRHRMLAEIAQPYTVYLRCVSTRQAIWKPRRSTIGQFNLSSGEARAVNHLLGAGYAHTPFWQGDMNAARELALTDTGCALLSEWDTQYGEVQS